MTSFRRKVVYIFFFSLIFNACERDTNDLDSFFEKLEDKLENKLVLKDLKSYPEDSLYKMRPIFRIAYNKLVEQLPDSQVINSKLEKLSKDEKEEIMLFAFQKYLNQKEIDLNEIKKSIERNKLRYNAEMIRKEKSYRKELADIITTNNLKYQEGDTLEISLQLKNDREYRSIYYSSYPASLDYSSADDTLKIKGILIKKFYSKSGFENEFDEFKNPLNLCFRLKMLELSHNPIYNFAEKLEVGNEFDLYLEAYGRSIY